MIYSTGTISINGNTATGSGTNWTAPASQVRAGQTIIVMSNPVQLFQISSVNSATSMTITPAASPALSGQKYAILVSDIISVDGLAQAMSQLIKEYDENIGAWETFATTSANQSITVTINGTAVTIPSIGKLAQEGFVQLSSSVTSDSESQAATPKAVKIAMDNGSARLAKDRNLSDLPNTALARQNLELGDSSTRNVGTTAGTVASGDDARITGAMQKSQNGGDIPDVAKFLQNLGLGEGSALPVGAPVPWPLATPPTGWLKCNGAPFSAEEYPELAKVYPTNELPDLRGEFIRGWDDGRGIDAGRKILSAQGDAIRNIVGHISCVRRGSGFSDLNDGAFIYDSNWSTKIKGEGGEDTWGSVVSFDASRVVPTAPENRPRSIAFNFIVRAA